MISEKANRQAAIVSAGAEERRISGAANEIPTTDAARTAHDDRDALPGFVSGERVEETRGGVPVCKFGITTGQGNAAVALLLSPSN